MQAKITLTLAYIQSADPYTLHPVRPLSFAKERPPFFRRETIQPHSCFEVPGKSNFFM